METTARERLNDVLNPYDRPGMPGLVATVMHGGQVVYQRCTGWADVEHGVPNGPDTVAPVKAQLPYSLTMIA